MVQSVCCKVGDVLIIGRTERVQCIGGALPGFKAAVTQPIK